MSKFITNEPVAPQIDPSKAVPEPSANGEPGSPNPNDNPPPSIDPTNPGDPTPPANPEDEEAKKKKGSPYSYIDDIDKPVEPGSGLDIALRPYIVDDDAEKNKPTEESTPPVEGEPAPTVKLEDMEAPALVEEVKKNQRLVTDRDAEITGLQTKIKELESANPADEEYTKFIEELKTNPLKAWAEYREKFKLPDVGLLKASLGNNVEEKLVQWQNNVAKKQIEKEFGLQEGEFELVKEDMYTPQTPSYRFRKLTEAKEKELETAISQTQETEKARLEKIKEVQQLDIKHYADTFLDGDLELARSKVQELNDIPAKINSGELDQSAHPFSLRNLLRGVNHDEIVAKKVEAAQLELIKKFNEKGMFLDAKELPTDIANLGTEKKETKDKAFEVSDKDMAESPMLRTMFQDLNRKP